MLFTLKSYHLFSRKMLLHLHLIRWCFSPVKDRTGTCMLTACRNKGGISLQTALSLCCICSFCSQVSQFCSKLRLPFAVTLKTKEIPPCSSVFKQTLIPLVCFFFFFLLCSCVTKKIKHCSLYYKSTPICCEVYNKCTWSTEVTVKRHSQKR